jgi:hypothetical protein
MTTLKTKSSAINAIVNTFEVFIADQRKKGNHCYYCIIDGQDTATILYAYGKLPQQNVFFEGVFCPEKPYAAQ